MMPLPAGDDPSDMTSKITVVMPNYNHGQYIAESLAALLSQIPAPAKILFIDDASTDGSLDIVRALAERHPQIEIIANSRNLGVVANCNIGLEKVATPYVYFAAADDKVLPGFLSSAQTMLDGTDMIDMASQASLDMTPDGQVICGTEGPMRHLENGLYSPAEIERLTLRFGNLTQGNATVYRKGALIALGGLPDIGPYADGIAMLALSLRKGAAISIIPRALWRRRPDSFSAMTQRNISQSLDYLAAAQAFLHQHLKETPHVGFAPRWHSLALYQIASGFVLAGQIGPLKGRVPGYRLIALLSRIGVFGRQLGNLLLLCHLAPSSLPAAIRHKFS
jgi:glycosyltransferase involved in cell wall biosynthesis